MTATPDRELRRGFDTAAAQYDRARPGYPAQLFSDLAELARLDGARLLEIGPGTGQATTDLLAAGAHVVAAEPGAELGRILAARLPDVPILPTELEDVDVSAGPFDVVAAFTSWHWLDPEIRGPRVHALLAPGGRLVTVTTAHIGGGTMAFFESAQDCYRRWMQADAETNLPPAEEFEGLPDEIDDSVQFEVSARRRYVQDIAYTTREYVDVIMTYSETLALDPSRRAGLLDCIGSLIEHHHGGRIVKRYLYDVRVATAT